MQLHSAIVPTVCHIKCQFLKFVQELGLSINHEIKVKSKLDFDDSLEIEVDKKISRVSKKFAQNILVIKTK